MTQALGMAPGLSSLVMYVGSTDAAIFNAMATAKPAERAVGLIVDVESRLIRPPTIRTSRSSPRRARIFFKRPATIKKWTTTGKASETYPADDVYVTSVGGTDLATSFRGRTMGL